MKIGTLLFGLGLFFLGISCKDNPKTITNVPTKNETHQEKGRIPETWVNHRVQKAKVKLQGTEAGRVIWNAMEAHGGLGKWYRNGPLSFRFNYEPLDGSTPRDSYQTIDTWSNRAKHTSATDSTAHFGWDGKTAWVKSQDSTAFAYDTRFWALTPIYFLGQPLILDGRGVNLELLPQKEHQGQMNDVVKVTFDAGTGDAPDDYYILYFNTTSHRLSVIRYIVSYPGYFKKGEHLPEKFMELDGFKTVEGITLPTSFRTYWLGENDQPGEYITKITVSNLQFNKNIKEGFFDVPKGAQTLQGI